jgi:hypothetical protein
MKFRRVDKSKTNQPPNGTYKDWKPLLAIEARRQCVYCTIHESSFGGIRNFHVEHYRPKSKFEHLINSIKNLFYACAICNTFKGDDWPGEPTKNHDLPCYPDPSLVDYADIISPTELGFLQGRNAAGTYLVERLYLNRPQLITERLVYEANQTLKELLDRMESSVAQLMEVATASPSADAIELLGEAFNQAKAIAAMQIDGTQKIPYSISDITRN